ncbi:anti-repressor SinI family protein [Peribacillus frigoritolerans]|nr:anti-repressor SinI family protein [Peribacillus frigoritolerans]USK75654.1 anti-repressor SinI family protein [Peribacillus frigoritolerans]
MTKKVKKDQDLSEEWIELVKEAMKSNISKEEFKIFLKKKKKSI